MKRFQAHLQRGGIGIEEMKRLLLACVQSSTFDELKKKAFEENLLGKTSEQAVKDALYTFYRLFLSNSCLPPPVLLAQVLQAPLPEAAKNQIIFPYFVINDPLVECCYQDLVLSRISASNPTLTRDEVQAYLENLAQEHPELMAWSEYLKKRWSRGFLTLLRRFGLMEQHPGKALQKLWLLPESFAFFLLFFLEKEGSFRLAMHQKIWNLLQLGEREKEVLLAEGKLRGWWTYERSGTIVHFKPGFATPKEWIENGLARSG